MATLWMVLSTVVSILGLVIASLIPFFALKNNWLGLKSGLFSVSALSMCNCFACGIFLATCFLGLIPHTLVSEAILRNHLFGPSNRSVNTHNDHMQSKPIGWAMFLDTNLMVLLGFLLIVLVEQSALLCMTPLKHSETVSEQSCVTTDSNLSQPKRRHNRIGSSELKAVRVKPTGNKYRSKHSDANSRTNNEIFEPLVAVENGGSSCSGLDTEDSSDCEFGDFGGGTIEFRSQTSKIQSSHDHHHHLAIPDGAFNTKSFFLMLAMSFHSIFEGIALGAQHTSAQYLSLLGSIMLHEILCSFSYGVTLSSQKVSTKMAVLSSVLLSLSIPIGLVVMASLGALEETSGLVVKFILEGLSAGIFIYVACVEMLSHEFSHTATHSTGKQGLLKTGFLLLGCATAYIFNSLVPM